MQHIRYHCDENVSNAIIAGLRRRGIDVSTTVEAQLMRANDPTQIDFATREGRVFVTSDRRIQLALRGRASHWGVLIIRNCRKLIGHNVNSLTQVHRNKTAHDRVDQVLFV